MKFTLKINDKEPSEAAYVGWTPVKCTLAVEGYKDGDTPVSVKITTGQGVEGELNDDEHLGDTKFTGELALYESNTPDASPKEILSIKLQAGNEFTFYVAGVFGSASEAQKDTFIDISSEDNSVQSLKEYIMVRVRKNANKLTPVERNLFLETFVRLNNTPLKGSYSGTYSANPSSLLHEIVLMHTFETAFEIHGRESFHPWHRAYLLHLEREMQAIDPRVTVPYWKFDEAADNVFTKEFVGETQESTLGKDANYIQVINENQRPTFNCNNPMEIYAGHTLWGPLRRAFRYKDPTSHKANDRIRDEDTVINYSDEFIEWYNFEETQSHNPGHSAFTGHVVDIGKDPVDPLFFMMHSNVDRLWAKWQHVHNRFDADDKKTYPRPYGYQGPRGKEWAEANPKKFDLDAGFYNVGSFDLGNYADDVLWPWDAEKEPLLSRPWRKWYDSEYGGGNVPHLRLKFPQSPTSNFPGTDYPLVKDTIDYQGRLDHKTVLGFDFDDIPYFDVDKEKSDKMLTPNEFTTVQYNTIFLRGETVGNIEEKMAWAEEIEKNVLLHSVKDQRRVLEIVQNKNEKVEFRQKVLELLLTQSTGIRNQLHAELFASLRKVFDESNPDVNLLLKAMQLLINSHSLFGNKNLRSNYLGFLKVSLIKLLKKENAKELHKLAYRLSLKNIVNEAQQKEFLFGDLADFIDEVAKEEAQKEIEEEADEKAEKNADKKSAGNGTPTDEKYFINISESEAGLDACLSIIANESSTVQERLDMVHEMKIAKRANRHYASRRPRFHSILRGLLTNDHEILRYASMETLSSHEDGELQDKLIRTIRMEDGNNPTEEDDNKKVDAILLLRQNTKNQHVQLFAETIRKTKSEKVCKAAIQALDTDPESDDFLKKKVIAGNDENPEIRRSAFLALHFTKPEKANDLAADLIRNLQKTNDKIIFTRFEASLMNSLLYTDHKLRERNQLIESLSNLIDSIENEEIEYQGTECDVKAIAFKLIGKIDPT
ncbi:MAG: tyrosinase family protein [Bacteroidota bacterium]